MNKRFLQAIARFALAAALLLGPLPVSPLAVQASRPEPAQPLSGSSQPGFAGDHLLVKLRSFTPAGPQSLGRALTGNAGLDRSLAQAGGRSLRPVFAPVPAQIVDRFGLNRVYRLDLQPGQDAEDALALLAVDPNVEYAEPDYQAQAIALPHDINVGQRRDKCILGPCSFPATSDPRYAEQWGLAKIQVEGAWAETGGSPAVVIAVVDSGIDLSHEDLADNLWVNPGEIPANGIDDDNNGFIDDVQGWNFLAGSADVLDESGHGTLVAGIAAAKTNNGKGIAGVCGECRIMPVKVMQPSGAANYSDIAAGIHYAVVKGARVINLSLGGYASSKTLQDAVNAALAQNIVVVAGAGNDNSANPFYPAAYSGVISVAAADSSDLKASFSNFGAWVKISAPGVNILTAALGGNYGPADGTSLAAPFAAGLAGLLVTIHPDWTPARILAQLIHTSDGIDGLNPGYAGKLGAGRINASQAVQPAVPVLGYTGYSANGIVNGRPDFNAGASLTVSLSNDWADALGVSGVLSTTDPLVTVDPAAASFGDILSGQVQSNSAPYAIQIGAAAGYNHAIPFALDLTANGGEYAQTINFTITTRSNEQVLPAKTIVGNVTWTSDLTYKLTGNIGIAPGATLTIQPGTTVRFNVGISLNVGGTLIADGTESQPIRLVASTSSPWGRIYFDTSGPDAVVDAAGVYQSGSILRWVQVQGAGQGIACNSATPYLSHLTLDGGGLNCTAGNTAVWLMGSDVTGNVAISGTPDSPWQTRASMPTPRYFLGVAAATNGKIYAVGGDSGFYDSPAEEYDPLTNTWTILPDMPTGRYGLSLAGASNGKIYAVGGFSGTLLSTFEEYDPAAGTWRARAGLPRAGYYIGLTGASNGKVYAIGGEDFSGIFDTVTEYDPETDTWTPRASMPTPRQGLGVAQASNGKIYAVGGYDNGALTTLEEYDPELDTWTARASLPVAIPKVEAVATNDRVYAFGDGIVAEYNPATDTWRVRPNMPTGRWGMGAAASNGKIYVIGGYGGPGILGTNEEFDAFQPDDGSFNVRSTTIRSGNLSIQEGSQVLDSLVGGSITVGNNIAGYSSTIQHTTAAGSITVNGTGTVADTIVSGGISIGSGKVLSNTLTGGGITAGGGSLVQGNNIQAAPGWGIEVSGTSTVASNRVVGGASGVRLQNGSLTGSLVANLSGTGLEINGSPVVADNTFTGIAGPTIIISSGVPAIHNTNLEFNTGPFDLVNATASPIDASAIWWGTVDPEVIDLRISDFYDGDYLKGIVTYAPPLSGPVQASPAYVRGVTLDPGSPVGIEKVDFTIQFSRPMDPALFPQFRVTNASSAENVWTKKTGLLTPRYYLGVATASNGLIYAAGGWNGSGRLATLEAYDPETDTWATKASMPTPRNGLGLAAASNGKLYAIGGENGDNIVEEYDPLTNTWATKANIPTGRMVPGVVAASNGRVYVIGGDASGAKVEEYDPATDTWAAKTSLPIPLPGLGAAAASNGKIYAMGGWNSSVYLSTVEEYDPATDTWAIKASMPTARTLLSVTAAANGRIYAIGGANGGLDQILATVEEYDPLTDTWATRASMPSARELFGAAAAPNGLVYAIGGYGGTQEPVEAYLPPGVQVLEEINGSPEWPAANLYRASYEFTSRIPRDTYHLTIQSAFGLDGLAIPPYQGSEFVLDYAGSISVTSPPNTPLVSAWGDVSLTSLSAQWTASDPHSAITGYRYAIGTAPGGVDVVNWTPFGGTSLTRSGLNLTLGRAYYVSVQARNEGGLWSLAGASNPVEAGVVMAPSLANISPTRVLVGSGSLTLTVNGANFTPASLVRWNGVNLVTTFVSSTQLTAVVDAGRLLIPTKVPVVVYSPGPGGGLSNALQLEIEWIKQFIPLQRKPGN